MGDDFLDSIITGDETWEHRYEPKLKWQSMEWRHKDWPTEKKFKAQPSSGKIMCSIFWDKIGVILVDILERGHDQFYSLCGNTEDTN
jgi:hypothetical protein